MLTGENGFSSYSWSTGSAESSITTSVRDDVTLTVIDANGCETSSTVTLSNYVVTAPMIDAPEGLAALREASLINERAKVAPLEDGVAWRRAVRGN